MAEHTLADTPEETWGNTILFRLAKALGTYPVETALSDGKEVPVLVGNPDQILDEALEIIWRYQDMADS